MTDTPTSSRPRVAPFGSWSSTFSPQQISASGVSLSEACIDGDATCWLELRPREGGRSVLVRHDASGAMRDLTPEGFNSRTRVHEYGGGAYAVREGEVWFTNFADQAIYRVSDAGESSPTRMTSLAAENDDAPRPASVRFADHSLSPDSRWIVCVRETHEEGAEARNEIVAVPTTNENSAEPTSGRVLATGFDFVANPRISPDGTKLAWISWDHPCMPWDGTVLWTADFDPEAGCSEPRRVAGGETESIFQPEWSPEGDLVFATDRSGWWNLARCDPSADAEPETLFAAEKEFGAPAWVFGMSRFAFLSEGRIACVYGDVDGQHLAILDPKTKDLERLDLPYSSFGESLRSDGNSRLVFVGSSPTLSSEIVSIDVDAGTHEVLRRSVEIEINPNCISVARPIEFPTTGDRTAHAFFYPPVNPEHEAPADEKPPLLVISHGGPTGQTGGELRLGTQFWTSRGVAVVDVDYRGSTGYGREYRERLKGRWGIVDSDDCIHAVCYLDEAGEIDPERVAIRGGSAGGYTTLSVLTFHDVFHAGASYFGVADLEALAKETHKFESRYLDGIIGPYPEARDLYIERSPIHHTDRLSCPVILLQGLEDKVVPPSQAEKMVEALEAKKLPYAYVPFEDEQHGFRKAENREKSLTAELYFYSRVFGFEPDGEIEPIEIRNLD